MNIRAYGPAPDAGDGDAISAARLPGSWLPPALRFPPALDPQLWQMRAARGFTWYRTGKATRRDYADYAQ